MSTATLSEVEASTIQKLVNPNSFEIVTKKRASFVDDVVISGVTITVDNYDQANDNLDGATEETLDPLGTTHEQHGHFELQQHDNLDPKLLQAAQLFVQDLIERAKIEVRKKLVSSERQVREFVCVSLAQSSLIKSNAQTTSNSEIFAYFANKAQKFKLTNDSCCL